MLFSCRDRERAGERDGQLRLARAGRAYHSYYRADGGGHAAIQAPREAQHAASLAEAHEEWNGMSSRA